MNAKMTKLKKGYVALATVIALMSVICVCLFAGSSFANEQHSFTQQGTLKLPSGEPMSNATVDVQWDYFNSAQEFIMEETHVTTDSNGFFTSTYSVDSDGLLYYGFFARASVGETNYYATDTVGHGGDPIDIDHPVHEYVSDKTIARYDIDGYLTINNCSPINNDLGYLTLEYIVSGDEQIIDNSEMLPLSLDHKNGSYSITSNNTATFKNSWFPFEDGWPDDLVFRAYAKPGYYLSGIEIFDNHGNLCPLSGILTKSQYTINFNIKPLSSLHTITIGDNIDSVKKADGTIVEDGDEVEHGTTLYITPAIKDKCVSKISVNGAINSTCVVVADGDLDISARIADAVKISGIVTADDSQVANGNKNFSDVIVQKAYAAEVGVEGAKVSFTSTDGWNTSTLTDSQGAYELDVEKGMGGTLTISKDGYNNFSKELSDEDLDTDVTVSSVLTAEKIDVPQTGDAVSYGVALMVLAVSAFAVYRTSRKPKGAHVK